MRCLYIQQDYSPSPIKTGIERFLASMYWNCCGSYRRGCVAHWTKLLPMRLFIPNPSFRTSFRSLITCRAAQIHTSYSVAPMLVLTNSQIGTEHRSWGWEHHQKRSHNVYPDNDNERRFVALVTANRLKLQKCDAKNKDFQLFILSSE